MGSKSEKADAMPLSCVWFSLEANFPQGRRPCVAGLPLRVEFRSPAPWFLVKAAMQGIACRSRITPAYPKVHVHDPESSREALKSVLHHLHIIHVLLRSGHIIRLDADFL